jgi:hypothetical protein
MNLTYKKYLFIIIVIPLIFGKINKSITMKITINQIQFYQCKILLSLGKLEIN